MKEKKGKDYWKKKILVFAFFFNRVSDQEIVVKLDPNFITRTGYLDRVKWFGFKFWMK